MHEGQLDSVEAKPTEGTVEAEFYPTLFTKVAAIGFTLAHDHVFYDANKRTAAEVMTACLAWNNRYARVSEKAMETVMLLVAAGHLDIDGLRLALINMYGLDTTNTDL